MLHKLILMFYRRADGAHEAGATSWKYNEHKYLISRRAKTYISSSKTFSHQVALKMAQVWLHPGCYWLQEGETLPGDIKWDRKLCVSMDPTFELNNVSHQHSFKYWRLPKWRPHRCPLVSWWDYSKANPWRAYVVWCFCTENVSSSSRILPGCEGGDAQILGKLITLALWMYHHKPSGISDIKSHHHYQRGVCRFHWAAGWTCQTLLMFSFLCSLMCSSMPTSKTA